MSFAARTLLSADGGGVVAAMYASLSSYTSGYSASASITLNTNGTISTTGNASYAPTNWFVPTTGSIGNAYWVKFTLNGGSAWDAGLTAGTVYALSSARTLTWTQAVVGGKIATATGNIYADAGGTVLVGTLSIDIDVERF